MDPIAALQGAWRRTDALFELVTPEALYDQPIALRQPVIFYVGHLPAFAWNQLGGLLRGLPPLDAALDVLFARGIDPVDVDEYVAARPEDWPTPDATRAYRDGARERLTDLAGGLDLARADDRRTLHTVVEHERMHHETLLYMFQQLRPERKRRPRGLRDEAMRSVPPGRARIPGGRVRLGADPASVVFGWDNEFPAHDVDVQDFTIDTTPVRNSELREFVEAGGYEERSLWDDDGWAWRSRRRLQRPLAWTTRDGALRHRTFFGDVPLDEAADWPASVSFAEAQAYARWRGARLPTEAELHRAAYGSPQGPRSHPWGESRPTEAHGNFGLRRFDPTPVGAFPAGASAWGVQETVGNGWEWTSTPFAPFPGFAPMPNYRGYSQDFFDGRHYVLLGASWATDEAFLRPSFRNWFQPHYPYVFSKFRCVTGE
jgi:ergothioneine biosynthesis protein EgtB